MNNKEDCDEPVIAAHQCYQKGDYSTALQHLNKLETAVGASNTRVQHNIALVEFMQSNMTGIDKFSNVICEMAGVNFSEIKEVEISSPYCIYNYAVLLYHKRYYYQTVHLLEKLLATSKNIKDKNLFQHIVLLLMEATLSRHTADKTLDIVRIHGDVISANSELIILLDRIVSRANLMLGLKIKPTLKPDTIENLFIIAQEQYMNKDTKEAINTLAQYKNIKYDYNLKNQGEDIRAAMNNNLGVVYLSLKKPFLSANYLQHALREYFKTVDGDVADRLITCRDRPFYVYNLGISLLATNKIEGAFECLVEAAQHFTNNARIWLRLAECCIKKCCNDESLLYSVKKIGYGPNSHAMESRELQVRYLSPDESSAIPTLSLEFAALCLRNASSLLLNHNQPADVTIPFIQVPPGPPINWKQRCYLFNSILILQSYVQLNLQDPIAALINANELLAQPEVAQSHKALAHIYAAAALININRVSEVTYHLNTRVMNELTSKLPSNLRYNIEVSVWVKIAVCHMLKGDLVTARKILLHIKSPSILPLQIYLEMCFGNIENCQAVLRKLLVTNLSK